MKAVGYIRWSSDKQRAGSSEERQRERIEEFCQSEGWTLTEWLTDEGVSAWKGDNIFTGSLSSFIDRMRIEGGQDYVLVVEAQDRLSRINEVDFFEWLIGVLKTGLTIALSDNEMIVDSQSFRNQKRQLRRIIDDQEEANRYVERLSLRSRGGWQKRRNLGLPVHTASTCPAWLRLTGNREGFEIVPERALIVERIFRDHATGKGYQSISRELNQEGVAPFRRGKSWRASAVKALLRSRAVIGEYQHKSRATGELIGDPVVDYFPRIISNELFQRANDPRVIHIHASRGGSSDKFKNIISETATCQVCGSKLTLIDKSRRGGGLYLQCLSAFNRSGCKQNRHMRYSVVERLLVETLLSVALDDVHFKDDASVATLSGQIANQRRSCEVIGQKLNNLAKALEDDADERLMARYTALRTEEKAEKARLETLEQELVKARGSVSPAEHLRRVGEIAADMNSEDEAVRLRARKVVKLAFNDLIYMFEFLPGETDASVHWTQRNNGARQYAVLVLRHSSRYIKFDLTEGKVVWDQSNDAINIDDPVLNEYRRRLAA